MKRKKYIIIPISRIYDKFFDMPTNKRKRKGIKK
jgi:hypothetical protein